MKHSILRQWTPDNQPNGYGAEIFLEELPSKDKLIAFFRDLAQDKDPVSISLFTDRGVYEDSKKSKYGEGYKKHFIAMYVKNGTGKGAFAGFNEIRWMQERGRLSEMFLKVTKL